MKSWKHIYLFSLAGCILLFMGLYVFGIRPTLDAYRSFVSISRIKQDPKSIMAKNQELESRFDKLSGTITELDRGAITHSYLNLLSHEARKENLMLRHFDKPAGFQTELFNIYESRFILSGSFKDTLKFIQKMEKSTEHGQIVSLSFYTEPSRNNQLNTRLICHTLSNR
jgi:hypothetical protein